MLNTGSLQGPCVLGVPASLQLADVLEVGGPVQAALPLLLQPALQLPAVHLQEVREHQALKDLTAAQDLVQRGAGPHVHQQPPRDVSWRRGEGGGGTRRAGQVSLLTG